MSALSDKGLNRRFSVDISGHHALCEMNFHRILRLLPGLRDDRSEWKFNVGMQSSLTVTIKVLECAPYTTTIEVVQNLEGSEWPRLVIRLYHDANMAEIVSWDGHRHWQPQYAYPNAQMYQPDEKLALNRFLEEWLVFCNNQGYACNESCDLVLVSNK